VSVDANLSLARFGSFIRGRNCFVKCCMSADFKDPQASLMLVKEMSFFVRK
jgi:hypothetical protein